MVPFFIVLLDIEGDFEKSGSFFHVMLVNLALSKDRIGSASHLLNPFGEIPPYQVRGRLLKSGMTGPVLKNLFWTRVTLNINQKDL